LPELNNVRHQERSFTVKSDDNSQSLRLISIENLNL